MFKSNKYTKWYKLIIESAQLSDRKYDTRIHEKHHIVPKSIGGDNTKQNLSILTHKEHYVCHLLLTKMCLNESDHRKMLYAFYCMGNKMSKHNHYTSRNFVSVKQQFRDLRSRAMRGANNHFYGKTHSEELKQQRRANNPAKRADVRAKMSESRKATLTLDPSKHSCFGTHHSDDRKAKISESLKGRKRSPEAIAKQRASIAAKRLAG